MRTTLLLSLLFGLFAAMPSPASADELPFLHKVEVYRNPQDDVTVFTLRLEQPFLAEEFEQSSYLRLMPVDRQAYLIYPKETKFQQKHAEFYGRLRGEGTVKLKLSYEIVSENLDGSRRVEVKQGDIEVPIPPLPAPPAEVGPKSIFHNWAVQQNVYFAELLRYYPEETFYQYCILQSQARYGVTPPPIARAATDRETLETDLYQLVTGSMAIQDSLQREALSSTGRIGDLTTHISALQPPVLRSLPYKDLLKKKLDEEKIEPSIHKISQLVPEDQYFVHFNSMQSLSELLDLSSQWGNNLLRLFTVRAQDQQLRSKLEDQLCLRRGPLTKLFADQVIGEVAATGADPFVLEGTDVTVIFRVKQPEVFQKAAAGWLEEVRAKHPGMVDQEFNARGHKVAVHYTKDRVVSAFIVQHEDYVIYSNSHRAIRRIIDAAAGMSPSLYHALDYRYVTTILPPAKTANSGYIFASEACIKRLVGPEAKISEKRRLQCFNNLVMLNNASLFYRLEYGRSPKTLSELVQGRFVDLKKVVCPHGGAYDFDVENDTCTCTVHNRLKYLSPNVELSVLNVSKAEAAEYERYKQRYRAFWQKAFNPLAVRVTVDRRLKLETCVLPFANGSFYQELQSSLDKNPQPLGTARIAPSAVASLMLVPGRENIGEFLGVIPGVAEALKADPTLTDLKWIGDRVGLHFCDGETILQIDPTKLTATAVPMIGDVPVEMQAVVGALVTAATMPVYVTVDVESTESAARLLEQLSQEIFLKKSILLPGMETRMDAYRLPDYKDHAIYVFSGQLYALKLRMHVALVGNQLVAATKPEVLREVIDLTGAAETEPPAKAHILLRLNRRALARAHDDLELYWAEKSRLACHRNITSIYNLCKLYEIPIGEVGRLSEAKYGVRYFCPDGGEYTFEAERNQVVCSVHGNRQHSRQNPRLDRSSSFAQFIEGLEEIVASLRFQDDALITTVEIVRNKDGEK
ncbi:MAG: hypothetical protein HQ567_08535 [Candidatus Nealsonbacteria bacterium]|nr:hypothetical protein [Candidatus Nealsonbacteria bacterium]